MDPFPVDLGPKKLKNLRKVRYRGDNHSVSVDQFAAADQHTIRLMYDFLLTVCDALRTDAPDAEVPVAVVREVLAEEKILELIDRTQALGRETLAGNADPLLAQALHDIRGGAFAVLVIQSQLISLSKPDAVDLRMIFLRARDHLKIMRNALLGLDDARRNADTVIKLHHMHLLLEKWQSVRYGQPERSILLEVECGFHGAISESCIEFSALDRILYNLINTAARHAASERVRLFISQLPEDPDNLRFLLMNQVTAEQAGWIENRDLFRAGVSTTGSGLGLAIVAGFVADAFGLASSDEAVRKSYLGAQLWHDQFMVWFHWPIVPEVVADAT